MNTTNTKKYFILSFVLLTQVLGLSQTPANWQAVGPIQFPVNTSGQINGIGRVCQMKFHPTNSQKAYAVSASGGLWISNNATLSWSKTGTDQIALSACASICIDPTNDSILYLGTGDPNYYSTSYGIYKSIDAGASWNLSNTGISNRMAVDILMDPLDHNALVAISNDGLWKSYDAGASWTVKKSGGQFCDAALRPTSGTRTIYAVNLFGQFYKSDDFGDTWTQITNGISVPGGGSANGMRLAVSAADSNIVYAGMIKDEGTIFKSTDGGNTFSTVYHNPAQSLVGYDANGGGQGNYNFSMCADPTNPNAVYVGAHVVWKSLDGGMNWTQLTQWFSVLHTDMHQMLFNPYNPIELYNINDGGVWRSLNAGVGWNPRSNGIEATEIYKAASNPLRKDMISIGTQDNGELYLLNGQWRTNRGGDWGSRMTYDYQNINTVYYHENSMRRNILGGNEVGIGFPFAPSNSTRMAFTPFNSDLGIAGSSDVYLSMDLSNTVPFWAQVSTFNASIKSMAFSPSTSNIAYVLTSPNVFRRGSDLDNGFPIWTSSIVPTVFNPSGNVCGIVSDTNLVYVTAAAKVYRSNDQGVTWVNVTGNLPNINIIGLISDPYATDESVYICNAAGVWYKNNSLPNWINYSQGMPAVANINDFMYYDDGPASSVLRIATYGRGVWESLLHPVSTGLIQASTPLLELVIAPNPAHQKITVKQVDFTREKEFTLQITNTIGQIVFEQKFNQENSSSLEISVETLPHGYYLVNLLNSSMRIYANGRFIKE